jgi:hypothetical protein
MTSRESSLRSSRAERIEGVSEGASEYTGGLPAEEAPPLPPRLVMRLVL